MAVNYLPKINSIRLLTLLRRLWNETSRVDFNPEKVASSTTDSGLLPFWFIFVEVYLQRLLPFHLAFQEPNVATTSLTPLPGPRIVAVRVGDLCP